MSLSERLREITVLCPPGMPFTPATVTPFLSSNQALRLEAANALDLIRAICEDGERSGADRLDEIYRIVKGEG